MLQSFVAVAGEIYLFQFGKLGSQRLQIHFHQAAARPKSRNVPVVVTRPRSELGSAWSADTIL